MIAAPASGSGKTMFTCGLLMAFKKRGFHVTAFKCGPDYIDPMFHRQVMGIPSRNLDTFLMGEEGVLHSLCKNAKGDLSVIEGVMGYYDGLGGTTIKAGSYDLASITKTNVILVVNAKGMSLSIVALIKGFLEYPESSRIKGIILNRVSHKSYMQLKKTIEKELPVKVYGYIPEQKELAISSRHLGLLMPHECADIEEKIIGLAAQMEKTVDIEGLMELAKQAEELNDINSNSFEAEKNAVCNIAVARDEAFSFYYEDNLDFLKEHGCRLVYFSPLHDKQLPKDVQGIIIGGGYPELYAKELSLNKEMRYQLKARIKEGIPVFAECGGFLYLHDSLEDNEGEFWSMVGIIEGKAIATRKLVHFGYSEIEAKEKGLFWEKGEKFPVHEFHYWDSEKNGNAFLARKPQGDTSWHCIHGGKTSTVIAGFPHFHFYGCPTLGEHFVAQCRKRR